MKTIVTGASGMLGSAVVRELQARREKNFQGWARNTSRGDRISYVDVELTDYREIHDWLHDYQPELIIHCAALTDADFCEENPGVAAAVNATASGDLARVAKEIGARFVHVSTDAVYRDDQPGQHREEDELRPLSIYAKTKLEGEGRVLAAYPEALVVRTTMFGWTLPTAPRPKFAEQILAALTNRVEIKLFKDALFSPLHVGTLAKYLLDLGELEVEGVLNVGSRQPISKSHFGRALAGMFGLESGFIVPVSVDDISLKAQRTKNVGMNVTQLAKIFNSPPRVEDGLHLLYEEAFDGTAEKIRGRKSYP